MRPLRKDQARRDAQAEHSFVVSLPPEHSGFPKATGPSSSTARQDAGATNDKRRQSDSAPLPTGLSVLGTAMLAALLMWVAAGCKSNEAGGIRTSSMVAVLVTNANTEAIRVAAIEVFLQEGYQAAYAGPNRLVFERRGGRAAEIAYGSLFDHEVWIRVKVSIMSVSTKGHLLECDAFIVRDKDAGHLEDETRLYKKGPYKELIRKVRDRVQDPQSGART